MKTSNIDWGHLEIIMTNKQLLVNKMTIILNASRLLHVNKYKKMFVLSNVHRRELYFSAFFKILSQLIFYMVVFCSFFWKFSLILKAFFYLFFDLAIVFTFNSLRDLLVVVGTYSSNMHSTKCLTLFNNKRFLVIFSSTIAQLLILESYLNIDYYICITFVIK